MIVEDHFAQNGSSGHDIGDVWSYAPAALEAIQGEDLTDGVLPLGTLRPKGQILSKALHPDLAQLIAGRLTYSFTQAGGGLSGPGYSAFALYDNGVYLVGGDSGMFTSTTGTAFAGVPASPIVRGARYVGNNRWLALVKSNTGYRYAYSTDNAANWTLVTLSATPLASEFARACETDGAKFLVVRGDTSQYHEGATVDAITTAKTGTWDKLHALRRIGTRWLAILDRTSQSGQAGLFTSDSADLSSATWTLRKAIAFADFPVSLSPNQCLQVAGNKWFVTVKNGASHDLFFSTDQGATWTKSNLNSGYNMAPGIAHDGVHYLTSLERSDDGITWRRWIQNYAGAVIPQSLSYGTLTANPAQPGSWVHAVVNAYSGTHIYNATELYDSASHFQLPTSSMLSGIPYPVMRVS